jgi:hypothetical protein
VIDHGSISLDYFVSNLLLIGLNRFNSELVQHSEDPQGDPVYDLQNGAGPLEPREHWAV